ncbi:hypothetical protein C2I18_24010 [Paenibacillus sp. PK3_47]|uniref:hypothetical protein n=1 Tax=Paenibacillus sp. PK3_47 TaxID=2072642 RepID=UPI00201E36A9|nr:hypothetical protein [Paenibacillus sp. PK3_47]UQZ36320.1 hypothetical protein C2I18_24010 [Paenibacillus sp. PK3_47]
MQGKGMEWWGAYEPFHVMLKDYRVADIVITDHAKSRYLDRIKQEDSLDEEIGAWLWRSLKENRVKPYLQSELNAYLIEEDIVIIAEFKELEGVTSLSGRPLYVMVIVSFLGRISAAPQLRDLQAYFARLRNSRRMKLAKKRRKRR